MSQKALIYQRRQIRRPQPLVSVVMPVYNAAAFLVEAIESILAQTYRPFEFVIVDDASTDRSWEIIRRYHQKYPRLIRAIRVKKNLNQGGDVAGNLAFQHTNPQSEFIARMDADDRSLPQRLEKQVAYLMAHPQVAIVGSSATVISNQGEVIGEKLVAGSSAQLYEQFFMVNPIIHPSVMVRRSALLDPKNLYRLELSANNDYLTFAIMAAQGKKMVNLSEKLIDYRVHETNDSIKNLKRTLFNTIVVRQRLLQEFGYQPSLKGLLVFSCHFLVLSWLPESLLRSGYLLARGMSSPTQFWLSVWQKLTLKWPDSAPASAAEVSLD